jgi:flagellar basal-body rod modification protein FlgD
MTTSVTNPSSTNTGVTSDVNNILNPAKAPARQVTADVTGGSVNSTIASAGDQSVFSGATKTLGKQDFLTLLVTQMRYQDPLQPQDNTAYVAQLAQFSQLEGTQNINTSIDDLGKKITDLVGNQSSSASAITNASATNLIGKYARVSAEDIAYVSGQSGGVTLNVHTDAGTDPVLSILDKDGAIVNVVPLTPGKESQIGWDGSKMDGTKAATGNYTLKVTSRDGTAQAGYAYFENKVNGISYAKDGVRLEINGQQIGMDQVLHVGDEPLASQD